MARGVFVQGVFVRGFMSGGFLSGGFVLEPNGAGLDLQSRVNLAISGGKTGYLPVSFQSSWIMQIMLLDQRYI